MTRSRALSSYVAALVLIVITMSLSYVVYEGVRSFNPQAEAQQGAFENKVLLLQGSPDDILRVSVNSSRPVTPVVLEVDGTSSQNGVLYIDGSGGYGRLPSSLCLAGGTAFFSVFTQTPGPLRVESDGQAWIDGRWASSLSVASGWNEVMISGASSCSVLTPNGTLISAPGPEISGVPMTGLVPSVGFSFYVPEGASAAPSQMVLVFNDGGYDQVV